MGASKRGISQLGVRWYTSSLLATFASSGIIWTAVAPVSLSCQTVLTQQCKGRRCDKELAIPNNSNPLPFKPTTPIPTSRMHNPTTKPFNPRNCWPFGNIQLPHRRNQEIRVDLVTCTKLCIFTSLRSANLHLPFLCFIIPSCVFDSGVETDVCVEIMLVCYSH
jgi:hypothetical protein